MSASLVGSEMCIRDSASPVAGVLLPRQALGDIGATYDSCSRPFLDLHERAAKADCLIVPLIG
eukprot:5511656-Alexandrium_andersonii.AAC.1